MRGNQMSDNGIQQFRVKATGKTYTAVAANGERPGRMMTVEGRNNRWVYDLYDSETGEIRSYLADHLEKLE
jgi:hypothetical protein